MVSKRKTNAFGFPIKDFGNDGGGGRHSGMMLWTMRGGVPL